jgi:hypothetical protein
VSARHRHVKKRIRALEREQQDLVELLRAYQLVIGDAVTAVPIATLKDLTRLQDVARERFYQSSIAHQREEELLALMPKSLHGDGYDPGDEEQYRDALPKIRSLP